MIEYCIDIEDFLSAQLKIPPGVPLQPLRLPAPGDGDGPGFFAHHPGDGSIGIDARVAFRRVEELIPQFLGLTNSS